MANFIAVDLAAAHETLAAGDLHRAEQYARGAHDSAVEMSFDPENRIPAIEFIDQAQQILDRLQQVQEIES